MGESAGVTLPRVYIPGGPRPRALAPSSEAESSLPHAGGPQHGRASEPPGFGYVVNRVKHRVLISLPGGRSLVATVYHPNYAAPPA